MGVEKLSGRCLGRDGASRGLGSDGERDRGSAALSRAVALARSPLSELLCASAKKLADAVRAGSAGIRVDSTRAVAIMIPMTWDAAGQLAAVENRQ